MSKQSITIRNGPDRIMAMSMASKAPDGTVVTFRPVTRSQEQNDRMWAMLADIRKQFALPQTIDTDDKLKVAFLQAYGVEVSLLSSLDGKSFVPYGLSSSRLSVKDMSAFLEFMFAWGAENNIRWSDPAANPDSSAPFGTCGAADAPVGDSSPIPVPTGEPSNLREDWREFYFDTLANASVGTRLLNLHEKVLSMIGEPNEYELEWMRRVWKLVLEHNKGNHTPPIFMRRREQLMEANLPLEF